MDYNNDNDGNESGGEFTSGMICPICKSEGMKSKVKFIGHREDVGALWDYDEQGNVIERQISVKIECDRGHKTDAQLRGLLDKAKQV